MPTYVYRCEQGHEVEAHRKIDDRDQPLPCRVCAMHDAVRLMARVPSVSTAATGFPGAASWRSR